MKYKQGPRKKKKKKSPINERVTKAPKHLSLYVNAKRGVIGAENKPLTLETSEHEEQNPIAVFAPLSSTSQKTKIPSPERRVESPVARKPKARREPLRLKS